jgi:FtsP/CotA-like multicopper oxidase with cupredoxin domain
VVVTRRQFALGSAAIVASGLVVCPNLGLADRARFTTSLPIPRLIDAAARGNRVELRAARGRHAFLKGKPTETYGYSAPILGPAIRVRSGDEIQMSVRNDLDRTTTVHWHGLLVPGFVDGGPQQLIAPGKTWRPVLKIDQPATTAWYHPHPHHDTARQIYMGLAGMILIDDGSDARLGLPRTYGVDDLPIILQDRALDERGSLLYEPDSLTIAYGGRGETIVANGAVAPVAKVPRGLVRLRLLNAANAQNYELRLSDLREFHVIASDSGFLPAPVAKSQLRISPAERYEILVDFTNGKPVMLETGPDEEMGIFGAVSREDSSAYAPILRFEPTTHMAAGTELPARLIEPPLADPAKAVRRRQFVLDSSICAGNRPVEGEMDMQVMRINGKAHDLARIDFETRVGTLEVWEIVSIGFAHSFHVHGASFRILTSDGAPPPAHLTGWKDVVLVENKAELLVAFNHPASREHPFMYHCHILEHEDAGMMGQYVCA